LERLSKLLKKSSLIKLKRLKVKKVLLRNIKKRRIRLILELKRLSQKMKRSKLRPQHSEEKEALQKSWPIIQMLIKRP